MLSDSGADVSEPAPTAGNSPIHDDGYISTSGSVAPGSTSVFGHEQEDQCPVRRGGDVGHRDGQVPFPTIEVDNADHSKAYY